MRLCVCAQAHIPIAHSVTTVSFCMFVFCSCPKNFSILWLDTSAERARKVTHAVYEPKVTVDQTSKLNNSTVTATNKQQQQKQQRKIRIFPLVLKYAQSISNPLIWLEIVLHCRRRRPLVWMLTIKSKASNSPNPTEQQQKTENILLRWNILQFDSSRLYGFSALASSIFA